MASSKQPVLSILIPSIPERLLEANRLIEKITGLNSNNIPIEILLLCDNGIMSIGEKRGRLLRMAIGKYVAFCDDDDDYTPNLELLISACSARGEDIITFLQHASVDGNETIVDFNLDHKENEIFVTDGITKRRPFHVCAWKRRLVKDVRFNRINWGEDWAWCERALKKIKTQWHINSAIHIYKHDKNISRAYAE